MGRNDKLKYQRNSARSVLKEREQRGIKEKIKLCLLTQK